MLKTLTLVKMNAGWTRDDFFKRWCDHTRDWDLRDHPEILLNRVMLLDDDAEYDGIAENHWPDKQAMAAAVAWYQTPDGRAHWEDLSEFMDVENSITVMVESEAIIDSREGVRLL